MCAVWARYVDGFDLTIVLCSVKLHPFLLCKRAEAIGKNACMVHKDIRFTTVGCDEAKPLFSVEPLDCSSVRCHRGDLQG